MKKQKLMSLLLVGAMLIPSFAVTANAKTKAIDLSKRNYVYSGEESSDLYFSEGLAKVWVERKYPDDEDSDVYGGTTGDGLQGMINKKGKEVIKPEWDELGDCQEGLISARKGNEWWVLDKKGNEVLNLGSKYDKVYDSADGLIGVLKGSEEDGKFGFINHDGEEVIKPKYDHAYEFKEGVSQVKKGEKWGVIDKNGKEIVKPKYDMIWSCDEGVIPFKKGKKWGLLDKKGKEVVKAKFDALYRCSEGYCVYQKGNDETGKFGFVDKKGKVVIKAKYEGAYWFKEGLAKIYTNQGISFINKKGKMIMKAGKYGDLGSFSDGRAAFVSNKTGLWGFLDKNGKEVIKARFEEIGYFKEGLAYVVDIKGQKSGYIDKAGNFVLILQKW